MAMKIGNSSLYEEHRLDNVILIDEPRWQAHGTTWAHLISDTSLTELHAFARRVGLPPRAFDLDHYDVPSARHPELVAAGAVPVPRRELISRLIRSGLRVPGHARNVAKREVLSSRWDQLLPGQEHIGADLLTRWHEPHRFYHGPAHLSHVLDSHALLVSSGSADRKRQDITAELLALWFHDAIYTASLAPAPATASSSDEERSAQLAVDTLGPVSGRNAALATSQVAEVARLVLITHHHHPHADDDSGAHVSDADLAVLGSTPDRYAKYVSQVRAEFRQVPTLAFAQGRANVLSALVRQGPVFRTPAAVQRWERQAQFNLRAELKAVTAQCG